MSKDKFKIGDKVVAVEVIIKRFPKFFKKGKIYTVSRGYGGLVVKPIEGQDDYMPVWSEGKAMYYFDRAGLIDGGELL